MNLDANSTDPLYGAPIHPDTASNRPSAIPAQVFFWKVLSLSLLPQFLLFVIVCHEAWQHFMSNSTVWGAVYVLLALAFLPVFLITFGCGLLIEQFVLYARTGIAVQFVIDLLCLKDEGFADFYKSGLKMSPAEAKAILNTYKNRNNNAFGKP